MPLFTSYNKRIDRSPENGCLPFFDFAFIYFWYFLMYFSDLSFTYVGNAAANLFPVSEFNRMHYTNINSLGDIVHCARYISRAWRLELLSILPSSPGDRLP
jgi:hypothetical protein